MNPMTRFNVTGFVLTVALVMATAATADTLDTIRASLDRAGFFVDRAGECAVVAQKAATAGAKREMARARDKGFNNLRLASEPLKRASAMLTELRKNGKNAGSLPDRANYLGRVFDQTWTKLAGIR